MNMMAIMKKRMVNKILILVKYKKYLTLFFYIPHPANVFDRAFDFHKC